MTKRFGFTLAEVLITLGIIGVVAAMTMPTLINQTNGAQYKAAYKKALSAIAQGITLNVALDDKSFADADVKSQTTDTASTNSVLGYLKSRMNVVNVDTTMGVTGYPATVSAKVCVEEGKSLGDPGCTEKTDNVAPDIYIFFNDSSMFAFKGDNAKACTSTAKCAGIIDVNGMKGPNKVVGDDGKPTDIYPVAFYDQTIEPASTGAKAVLYGK